MKSLQNLREQRAAKAVEVRNKLDTTVTTWDAKAKADVDQIYDDILSPQRKRSIVRRVRNGLFAQQFVGQNVDQRFVIFGKGGLT